MRTREFHVRLVLGSVVAEIGFQAFHSWMVTSLERQMAQGRGITLWWIFGGFGFLMGLVTCAIAALRISGEAKKWMPPGYQCLRLCGSAVVSTLLLNASVLLALSQIRGLILEYRGWAFVSNLFFYSGFFYFVMVLYFSMIHDRIGFEWNGAHHGRRLSGFAEAFTAGRKLFKA